MSGCLWSLLPLPIMLALYTVIRQPLTKLMSLTAEQVTTLTELFTNMSGYVAPTGRSAFYAELTLANYVHQFFDQAKAAVPNVMDIDFGFLGLNLGEFPQWNFMFKTDWSDSKVWLPALGLFLIPVVSGLLSYFSMKVSQAGTPMQNEQQNMKGMMLMMPLFSVYIGFIMPAALGIYWITNNILAIIQDAILNAHFKKVFAAEDAERLEQERLFEAELEKKRQETEKLRAEGKTAVNTNTSKKKIQAVEKQREEERIAAEKAAEKAARKAAMGVTDETPDSAVGDRLYARGRAYMADRYRTGKAWEEPEAVEEEAVPAASEEAETADVETDPYEDDSACEAEESERRTKLKTMTERCAQRSKL